MTTEVLVTCGGTSEPIDSVRVLTNLSAGRFGHALAEALAAYPAYSVTEACPLATKERFGPREGVTYRHFKSTADLQDILLEEGAVGRNRIIVQAAAVSDYRPLPVEGKISSTEDELVLRLGKTPKLIGMLRSVHGPKAFIVGFKLLVGVPRDELVAAAMAQLKANRLNMVVANDLHWLRNGQHPILVITAEGGVIPFEGDRATVARALAEFIHTREQVSWFQSLPAPVEEPEGARERFQEVLTLANELNLLTDASGNISLRHDGPGMLLTVSPRGVDKSLMVSADALQVRVDATGRTLHFDGVGKPSIDTGMEALIYEQFPNLDTVVHFHRGWGRMDAKTAYPYPCGVVEEGSEVIRVAKELKLGQEGAFGVELIHHGFFLALTHADLRRLEGQWAEVLAEWELHREEVLAVSPQAVGVSVDLLQPIWDGVNIVGLVNNLPDAGVVYCGERARGRGLGRVLIEQVIERGLTIQTLDACQVRDFYKAFGFTETVVNGFYRLTPPVMPLRKQF